MISVTPEEQPASEENAFQDTFQSIAHLLEGARGGNMPIIHATSEHSAWSQSPSKKERFGRQKQSTDLAYYELETCRARIYHPFTQKPGDLVVVKHRYSAGTYVCTDHHSDVLLNRWR